MTTTATKERPILMSAPMVTATLAGRKWQTRRFIKSKHPFEVEDDGATGKLWPFYPCYVTGEPECIDLPCPHGKPGDLLWVRETFRDIEDPAAKDSEVRKWGKDEFGEPARIVVDYRADNPRRMMDIHGGKPRWKPSIFMPRWASRITLEIKSVSVERLNGISEADAIAEGINLGGFANRRAVPMHKELWESINGPESWAANPWVWKIEFARVELPVVPGK